MRKIVTMDARWLVGGIGTYTRNLLREFHRQENAFDVRAIARTLDSEAIRKFCSDVTLIDAPIYTVREQFLIPKATRQFRSPPCAALQRSSSSSRSINRFHHGRDPSKFAVLSQQHQHLLLRPAHAEHRHAQG